MFVRMFAVHARRCYDRRVLSDDYWSVPRLPQCFQTWIRQTCRLDILLGLLRPDIEGDWPLHLSCIRSMIPWWLSLDKINYASYLPIYYAQMSRLHETSSVLHDHFLNGGFFVQLRNEHPFARIAVDQTTEQTVNKLLRRQERLTDSVSNLVRCPVTTSQLNIVHEHWGSYGTISLIKAM